MIVLQNVSKKFGTGVFGLSDISFSVEKGEFLFLVGPTGAGKTTIFKLLIKESDPSEGSIRVGDWEITKLPKNKIPQLRKKIGVVFQDLKLLLDRTVLENILLPLDVIGLSESEAKQKASEILTQVGIIEHKDKFPVQLSGGELQRAAIARALVLEPEVLLADEPTGNLDAATGWEIVKLLSDINDKGTTVIMATHNADVVKSLKKREIELERGSITKDQTQGKSHKVAHKKAASFADASKAESDGQGKDEDSEEPASEDKTSEKDDLEKALEKK